MTTKILHGRWLDYVLSGLGMCACIATVELTARAFVELTNAMALGLAALSTAIFLLLVRLINVESVLNRMARVGVPSLGALMALGIALRLGWVMMFHPQPSSDAVSYLSLAHQLIDSHSYGSADALAYWPPGFPFFMTLFVGWLPQAVAVTFSQLLLFVFGIWGVHTLGRDLGGDRAGRFAAALFAVWPNLLAHAGSPEKEMLVLVLLLWAFIMVQRRSLGGAALAGVLCGAATLVQPSTQFLIPACVLLLILQRAPRLWQACALFLLAAVLTLAPWTARNYAVFGQWKLVSTNGGDNLYRANNPLATGGYTERGEVDLSTQPELVKDAMGKALAIQWIRNHPAEFAKLSVEKQLRFMGDDASGVYVTFRAQGEARNGRVYLPLKAAANAWWIAAWILLAALAWRQRVGAPAMLVWIWLYFYVLHGVFESAAKYHAPVLWVPCVLLGVLLGRSRLPASATGRTKETAARDVAHDSSAPA